MFTISMIVTVIGLIMDITGVIVIALPHVTTPPVSLKLEKSVKKGASTAVIIGKSTDAVELNKFYHANRWGLVFLVLGFLLQIVGQFI